MKIIIYNYGIDPLEIFVNLLNKLYAMKMKPTKCDPVNIFDAINNWENNTWRHHI